MIIKARYRPHFTDMQEPSGVEKRDMTITNNTPREALWTRGYPTEDHQIRNPVISRLFTVHGK
jgi:hypothetical protein